MRNRIVYLFVIAALLVSSPVLSATLSMQGTVVDQEGNPVGGVSVYAVATVSEAGYSNHIKGKTVTSEDGKFSFSSITIARATWISLIAFEPDKWLGGDMRWSVRPDKDREELEKAVIITVSKPSVVEGQVVDEAGKPISGADVSHGRFVDLRMPAADRFRVPQVDVFRSIIRFNNTQTDQQGRYKLTSVPEHLMLQPSVIKPDWAMKPVDYKETIDPARVVMIPGGTISGRLVRENGRPIVKALVTAGGSKEPRGWGKDITASDGSFTIKGLTPDEYELSFHYIDDDHITLNRRSVRVAERKDTALGKVVYPNPVTVTGRVLDEETGEPVSGAQVSGSSMEFHSPIVTADGKGVYKLKVLPGTVYISYMGGRAEYARDFSKRIDPITVDKKGHKGFDIRIQRSDMAEGVVLDEAGKPLAGALVSVGSESPVTTDTLGKFKVPVPPSGAGGG